VFISNKTRPKFYSTFFDITSFPVSAAPVGSGGTQTLDREIKSRMFYHCANAAGLSYKTYQYVT